MFAGMKKRRLLVWSLALPTLVALVRMFVYALPSLSPLFDASQLVGR